MSLANVKTLDEVDGAEQVVLSAAITCGKIRLIDNFILGMSLKELEEM